MDSMFNTILNIYLNIKSILASPLDTNSDFEEVVILKQSIRGNHNGKNSSKSHSTHQKYNQYDWGLVPLIVSSKIVVATLKMLSKLWLIRIK